ncbi:MAG: enoyl-[acyl-carrier-protein] reductase FabK, partial [Nostocales cyanobacterium W4_Combined_metabat2_030]|nr:enoyl-[acyl-carrier-protein] reductase FabK [Nostocales cyanobacterium W4_Combined_metabat2_030]
VASQISKIQPAAEIIQEIMADAEKIVAKMASGRWW